MQIVEDVSPLQLCRNGVRVMGTKTKLAKSIVLNRDCSSPSYYSVETDESLHSNSNSFIKTVSNRCFATLGEAFEVNRQFSSTTIVNRADTEGSAGVTTLHLPFLGVDPMGNVIEVSTCSSALGLPWAVETLEVPGETALSGNEIQSFPAVQTIQTVHVSDRSGIVTPADIQPMVLASTDSQGNCFVALQDNPNLNPSNIWRESDGKNSRQDVIWTPNPPLIRTTPKSISQVPTVTKFVNNRHNGSIRSFVRYGRSRMIADQITTIPGVEFKSQLKDTSDIIGELDLAPTTKRLMNYLKWKGIGKLFAYPGHKMLSSKLSKLFRRHLRTRLLPIEETFGDMKLLPVGYKPEVDPSKIKRITRRRRYPEAEEYQRRMMQEQMQQNFQTQIEAVFLDNSESFKEDEQGNLHMLVEAAENGTCAGNVSNRVVNVIGNEDMDDSSIIVIHEGQESNQGTAYTQQNIEVLLAAAAESGCYNPEDFHQVIICQQESDQESVLQGAGSIIIVPNDQYVDSISETVVNM